ncbi:MAG: adenosylcobalamin-dependent ribonucleoside-diphosphate reductase [Candidatus Omnitrophica bacterium]|jgi:ribonucleoside-diphosphate reductase alpha chain|nr:adenosylcobalamin-dependent ribonucleoside-diphosphate reductase [Candidatus Omnitrophota bacterium]
MRVIKRDEKLEEFNYLKIHNAISKAAKEVLNDKEADNLLKIILPRALAAIKKYEKQAIPIEYIQDIVEETLMKAGYPQVAKAYILYRNYRQDLRVAKEKLGIKDGLKLSLNAISVLSQRYLLRDDRRRVIETPVAMFKRVSDYVAKAERNFSSKNEGYFARKFYEKMSSLEFLPNSPTLMNAGTKLGQLSACFVLPVNDSMEDVFNSLKAMALIHQTGGGTGFSFSRIRPKGDLVLSTKGQASGPVSFMQIFDKATDVVMQGGRRRGANMGILKVNHPDIVEFVEAKLKEGVLENFNISVGITDDFIKTLRSNGYIELINPRTRLSVKKIKAKTLFSLISLCAYKYADPGLIFLDRINKTHPLRALGAIEATNPCGEIPLLPYESCNLASVNLAKFVRNKKVNWQALEEAVKIGVRFLDNVIEINKYPLKQIEEITKANRKVGLGVMGFADMLIKLRIPYNSKEAVRFARVLMRFIRKSSLRASYELAKERGVFKNYKYSIYAKKNLRLRNATVNSIAPTGTISIIAGCSSGIEPVFALSFSRNVLEGNRLFEVNPLLEEVIREEGLYSRSLMDVLKGESTLKNIKGIPSIIKKTFVTTFDINAMDHLKIQAAFQEYTDNAVSKTINLSENATLEDVEQIYLAAYDLKLKGITIYRYGSKAGQVLRKEDYEKEIANTTGSCFRNICIA